AQCGDHRMYAFIGAGDRHLQRTVVVRDDHVAGAPSLADHSVDARRVHADHRGHRALRAARGSEAAALRNETKSIFERQHACRRKRRVLAEGMTGDKGGTNVLRKERDAAWRLLAGGLARQTRTVW